MAIKHECRPIGQAVNPNIAMVAGFMCHPDGQVAIEQGLEGFQFFSYALSHYYIHAVHVPGEFDLWADFQHNRPPQREPTGCIGNPAQVRAHLEMLEAAGVDQVIFVQQAGNNQQAHILESLEIFGEAVLPAFQERERERAQRKAEELQPYVQQAIQQIEPIPRAPTTIVESYPVSARRLAGELPATTPIADQGASLSSFDGVETALLGKRA